MMRCSECHSDIVDDSHFCHKCGAPTRPSEEILISQTRTLIKPTKKLLPGSLLAGKYKIKEVIGRGGMGVVYSAEDLKLKRKVALKFLSKELLMDEEAKDRFILEAQTAASLSHPNICTIHEINEEDGKSFIVMEYVEGENLRDKIGKRPMSVDEVLDIIIQIAHGLDEAHKKGIIHRDIKSVNIMVTEKGQAKIMDFGLAKVRGSQLLTREGTTLGTVAYMAPEQAKGEEVDHRTDIWSLGVVFYELASGKLPFNGDREASVLYSVVHEEPKPLKAIKPGVPAEFQQIINRALEKNPENRYSSAAEILKELKRYQDSLRAEELGGLSIRRILRKIREPKIAVPAVCAILVLAFFSIWFFNRQAKIRWAKQEALPAIERLIESNWRDFTLPYRLAEQAEKYIPNDPKLGEYLSKCSLKVDIKTEPSGAEVYVKEYKDPDGEWEYLGMTPIENLRLPVGIFRFKMEKEGYETVMAASSTWDLDPMGNDFIVPYDIMRVLDEKESIPKGMVRVQGAETPLGRLDDFYIDRFEVTNEQYKEFVNKGGYRNKEYWKHEFVQEGEVLSWEEATAKFVDQTGRPGPSTWRAGDYPEGQGNHPVSGVSWYEAAAYAEFVGKSLPTGDHWGVARGEYTPLITYPQLGGYAVFAPFSNFNGKGPMPAGSLPGITSFGAYDMAGNVREWCWNETRKGRLIRGGAWSDAHYMFKNLSQIPAFDRSPINGFRCVFYPEPESIPSSLFGKKDYAKELFGEVINFYETVPVADPIFEIYKEQFSYDRIDMNPQVELIEDSAKGWSQEKIVFDAAYGDEKIVAYLFVPKNAEPPYQTVIYFPGSPAVYKRSSQDLANYFEYDSFLSFIVKNGRAVLFPVYKGTFERGDSTLIPIHGGANNHKYTEYFIQLVKEFKRCIDYLEIREDIDDEKLAYYGASWGAMYGAIIPAVEERIKTSVLLAGGLRGNGRPEVNQINYISRVKIPTLMLNGKYDTIFSYEKSIKPMFDLLGTPDEHKKLKLYETDHIPPMNGFITEILAWLDRYLGPVYK